MSDNSKTRGRKSAGGRGADRVWRQRGARSSDRRQAATDGEDAHYLYGLHAVEFALRNPRRSIFKIWATENAQRKLADALAQRSIEIERASPRELDRRVGSDAVHQGIVIEAAALETVELEDLLESALACKLPIVLLDQVTDPQNVGAVLRSGAVFGVAGVIMTGRHSPPLGAALAKAASGAMDLTPVCLVQNLSKTIETLRQQSFAVIGLDGAVGLRLLEDGLQQRTGQGLALALGAEGKGLRELTRQSCDELCRIAGDGPIASLNVSNAAAVALHLAAMSRRRSGV
ncbi:MAG: 23S rRNA (guanosine(2251)-2'-O)-methyltransferase RlmB [Alphaproteobacteria bacterium]|nr:23S rRNA (guanosine(2251)-2'-O)-methyltransferase RlmB [Alphaproteobacteria bacterium]